VRVSEPHPRGLRFERGYLRIAAGVNVLFVCVANSGRSLMAERLFQRLAGDRHQARSAGSEPGSAAHPHVLEALQEIGIDASDHVPRKLDSDDLAWADVAVSTCKPPLEQVRSVAEEARALGTAGAPTRSQSLRRPASIGLEIS
jgi:protein-tyrosine-phosphatase